MQCNAKSGNEALNPNTSLPRVASNRVHANHSSALNAQLTACMEQAKVCNQPYGATKVGQDQVSCPTQKWMQVTAM